MGKKNLQHQQSKQTLGYAITKGDDRLTAKPPAYKGNRVSFRSLLTETKAALTKLNNVIPNSNATINHYPLIVWGRNFQNAKKVL